VTFAVQGKKAHHGEHGDRLAGAGLADDRQHFAGIDMRSTRHRRRGRAGRGLELDDEILISRSAISGPLQFGIERIAQTVAHQVDGENGDQDAHRGT
jgi:hypothetical protein